MSSMREADAGGTPDTPGLTPGLSVAPTATGALLAVTGHATAFVSPTLDTWVRQTVAAGAQEIVIDLREALAVDSTVIGCLVQLRLGFPDQVQIGALSPTVDQVLKAMHLIHMLAPVGVPSVVGPAVPLVIDANDSEAIGRHVIACHLALAEQGGPQSEVFAALVAKLRGELNAD